MKSFRLALLAIIFVLLPSQCSSRREAEKEAEKHADSLYFKADHFINSSMIKEGSDYFASLPPSTDALILQAYMNYFSSDSTAERALLDSAWAHADSCSKLIQFKRLTYSAAVYNSACKDHDKAIQLSERAIALTNDLHFQIDDSNAYIMLAHSYYYKGKHLASISALLNAEQEAIKENNDESLFYAYYGLARDCGSMCMYGIEYDYCLKAIEVARRLGYANLIFMADYRMGYALEHQGDIDASVRYFSKAINLARHMGVETNVPAIKSEIDYISANGPHQPDSALLERGQETEHFVRNQIRFQGEQIQTRSDNRLLLTVICLAIVAILLAAILIVQFGNTFRRNRRQIKNLEDTANAMALSSEGVNDTPAIFMARFNAKFPTFIVSMQNVCPDLTEADVELCAMIYAGCSNEQICSMRNISLESLRAARYRLRTKLSLQRKDNLESFIRRQVD